MQFLATALSLMVGAAEAYAPIHRTGAKTYNNVDIDYEPEYFDDAITPKAFIVSLFEPEKAIWHKHMNFSRNVTLPGLSPIYPYVYCTENYDVCNAVTGEGQVNAAASISALLASPKFNLTETYFLVAGIAGINPEFGALGSAAFSRYTVTVDLQYGVDSTEKPKNWTTGYWAYSTQQPGEAPKSWYGTEVFEVNEKLRDRAAFLASNVSLAGNITMSREANKTDNLFNQTAAHKGPVVMKCDSATSDVYYTGNILAQTFSNFSSNVTNGTAKYCVTAQEDAAVLEAALRSAKFGLTDYSRWVLLRTGSDFDRPPVKLANDTVGFFLNNNTGGFDIAVENLYKAGNPFIQDVLKNWNTTYRNGTYIANTTRTPKAKNGTFASPNYVGDVFGSLGGKPDFGPGSYKDFTYVAV